MASFDDVVIISGCRTAVGKFQGSLSDLQCAATRGDRCARGREARWY